jgi:hypothetical protein
MANHGNIYMIDITNKNKLRINKGKGWVADNGDIIVQNCARCGNHVLFYSDRKCACGLVNDNSVNANSPWALVMDKINLDKLVMQ